MSTKTISTVFGSDLRLTRYASPDHLVFGAPGGVFILDREGVKELAGVVQEFLGEDAPDSDEPRWHKFIPVNTSPTICLTCGYGPDAVIHKWPVAKMKRKDRLELFRELILAEQEGSSRLGVIEATLFATLKQMVWHQFSWTLHEPKSDNRGGG